MSPQERLHPPGTEVARLALPIPAAALFGMNKTLERAYGKGLRIRNSADGREYVLVTPTEEELALDRAHDLARRRERQSRTAAREEHAAATHARTRGSEAPA